MEKEIHKNSINSKWWAASEQAIFDINWQNYLGNVVRLAQKCVLLEKSIKCMCFTLMFWVSINSYVFQKNTKTED